MNDRRRHLGFAWLQLLRLPNLFTAVADVMMGFLVTHGSLQPAGHFALLVTASCLLYLSGMVLNDVHDADVDVRERPDRPIPSGRVPYDTAEKFGWALWVGGILVVWVASIAVGSWRPGVVGTLLAASIVLYDFSLKTTPTAPLVMGACRMLNVLLGMSLAGSGGMVALEPLAADAAGPSPVLRPWHVAEWVIAAGIGVYITGVTWFARTEARQSSRWQLVGGTVVLLAGIALVASLPAWWDGPPWLVVESRGWYLLWSVLALITVRRCVLAILQPSPPRVQIAVRHCVHSLIVLDAAVCLGYVGIFWGLAVLLLLVPTMLLTAWLDAT